MEVSTLGVPGYLDVYAVSGIEAGTGAASGVVRGWWEERPLPNF